MLESNANEVTSRTCCDVLGIGIDVLSWPEALGRIERWASRRESRYICITNVHSVVTGRSDPAFGAVLNEADTVTPDGAPVAWMLRRLGHAGQERINGPDLMWRYCQHAESIGQSIYLLGGTEHTLRLLTNRLEKVFPGLKIAGAESPPFRALTQQEDHALVERINTSGAGSVWVSLGCPKQELWMASHKGRVHGVMVGVGAAFDYHAGTIKRAPLWMQRFALEWLFRLMAEPRRLWRRYLVTNSLFVVGAARQLWFTER